VAVILSIKSRRIVLGGIALAAAGGAAEWAYADLRSQPQPVQGPSGVIQISPSGDPTGVTDTARINAALSKYPVVQMLPGTLAEGAVPAIHPWYVNAPIIVPPGTRLTGGWYWQAVDSDDYSAGPLATGGVLIIAVKGFHGASVIAMVNDTGGQQGAQVIEGITIEGDALPAGSGIHGILIRGAVGAGFIQGVTVHRPDGDCLHAVTDSGTGLVPDSWQVSFSKFSASRSGRGVYLAELPDSWFVACESSENQGDNWYCAFGTNTRFLGCKGENSKAGNGWHFGGLFEGQVIELTGCTSQLNAGNGFLFDDSAGRDLGTYALAGCRSWRDGRSRAKPSAGFAVEGCQSRVIGTGCVTSPDSAGSAYGASHVGGAYGTCFTGAYLAGTVAPVLDDGTGRNSLIHQSPVPF
jgi:hypothetical protein